MNTKTRTQTNAKENTSILKYINMNDSLVREVIEKERIKEEIRKIRNKVLNSNLEKHVVVQINAIIHRVELYAFVFKSIDFAKLELEEVKKMLKKIGINMA
jgi:hypothetical protein